MALRCYSIGEIMAICAVVQITDGLVVNKIVAEVTDIAPDGCNLIAIDEINCDIGWVWDGISFISQSTESN